MPNFTFSDLEEDDITVDPATVLDQQVIRPVGLGSVDTLPYAPQHRQMPMAALAPFVAITIDGHPVEALVDTATETDIVPAAEAGRFGLRIIGRDDGARDSLGQTMRSELAVADTMAIGDARFLHHLVNVTPSHFFVVGMSTLRQLGRVRLSRDGMRFGPGVPGTCTEPMALRNDLAGHGQQLVTPIVVDGEARQAILDTGNTFNAPVEVFKPDFDAGETARSSASTVRGFTGTREMQHYQAERDLSITGVPLGRQAVLVEHNGFNGQQQSFVTANSLLLGDWMLDFGSGTACFLRR